MISKSTMESEYQIDHFRSTVHEVSRDAENSENVTCEQKRSYGVAIEYIKKDQDFCSSPILSDEKIFCLGLDLMILAAISKKDKMNLLFGNGKLNAQSYNTTSTEYFLLLIEDDHIGEDDQAMFQQSYAAALSPYQTKDWFFGNFLAALNWPAKSADLNVIQNARMWLVKYIY